MEIAIDRFFLVEQDGKKSIPHLSLALHSQSAKAHSRMTELTEDEHAAIRVAMSEALTKIGAIVNGFSSSTSEG
jgi:hypothetical protein